MARNARLPLLLFVCCARARGADFQETQDATMTRILDEKREVGMRLIQMVRSLKPMCNADPEKRPDRFLSELSPEIRAIGALGELQEATAVYYSSRGQE